MRIEIDGRKFVARKPKGMNTDGYGCRGCTFDTPGDCALRALSCTLPLGHVWRETAWSRFKTFYAQEIAGPFPFEEHDTMGRGN